MSSIVTQPGRLQSLKLILLWSPLQLACLQNQRLACAQSLITVAFVHDRVLHLALAQRLSTLGYAQITWGLVRCGPQFCGPWVGLESCLSSMFCCCQCWGLVRCGCLFCRPWWDWSYSFPACSAAASAAAIFGAWFLLLHLKKEQACCSITNILYNHTTKTQPTPQTQSLGEEAAEAGTPFPLQVPPGFVHD